MRTSHLIVLSVLTAALVGAWMSFGSEMYVVPGAPLRVVRDLESLNLQDSSVVVATLQAGDRVQVIGCRNLKDDQVYRVRAGEGVDGYVADTDFTLERVPWTLLSSKVVCY